MRKRSIAAHAPIARGIELCRFSVSYLFVVLRMPGFCAHSAILAHSLSLGDQLAALANFQKHVIFLFCRRSRFRERGRRKRVINHHVYPQKDVITKSNKTPHQLFTPFSPRFHHVFDVSAHLDAEKLAENQTPSAPYSLTAIIWAISRHHLPGEF